MGAMADATSGAQPSDNELRTGTVVSIGNPNAPVGTPPDGIYVRFSADPNADPVRCSALTHYGPVTGDIVQVLREGSVNLILGVAAPLGLAWQPITPLATWQQAGGGGRPIFSYALNQTSKKLYVVGELVNGTKTDGTTIGHVPITVVKPVTASIGAFGVNTTTYSPMLQLQTNGNLQIFGCTNASEIFLDVSFSYNAP